MLMNYVQFSSVAQLCPTLCDPMDCSTPGLPVHHQLPEFPQTHVHWVSDAIHPLSSTSPPAFNLSQHQGLFKWVSSLNCCLQAMGLPHSSVGKESTCSVGDLGSITGLWRSPGEGKGYPLQYSGLENSMDCIVHGVTKSQTWLSNFHFISVFKLVLSKTQNWLGKPVCFTHANVLLSYLNETAFAWKPAILQDSCQSFYGPGQLTLCQCCLKCMLWVRGLMPVSEFWHISFLQLAAC